jgi:hypothetical protein
MAANLHATQHAQSPGNAEAAAKETFAATPIHTYLARLAALHDEAAETAHLANLLGRTPLAASALGVAGIITVIVAFKTMPSPALALWLAMMTIAIAATALVYGRASDAPFDSDSLTVFARNLSAVLIFTGAAWGSGVALALPDDIGVMQMIIYALGAPAAIAAIFRVRDIGNCFVVPATATAAFCALMRDLSPTVTIGILMGGTAIVVAAALSERIAPFHVQER